MGRSFLPVGDDAMLSFALNFSTLLTANYAAYDVAQAVATTYAAKYNTYKSALAAAKAPETRGNATVLAKKTAKNDLIDYTRQVARTIGNDMNVTDAQRQALGLTIRKVKPTPVPAPSARPAMELVSMVGRTATVNVYDSSSRTKRGKPASALGAKLYTFVGDAYPTDPTLWAYQGDYTKTKCEIVFDDYVENGAQVWVCAAWYNRKGETGPISVPLTTNVQGGGSSVAGKLKIAA